MSGCTPPDQLLNFFRLVAEVAVQQKSANSAIAIDRDNQLRNKHLGEVLASLFAEPSSATDRTTTLGRA